jgi:hypothetical protein
MRKSYVLELKGQPSRHPNYVPTGRIWPSGDFSVGYTKVDGDSRVEGRGFGALADADAFPLPKSEGWSIGEWGVPRLNEGYVYDGKALLDIEAELCHQNPALYSLLTGIEGSLDNWEGMVYWLALKAAKLAVPLDLTVPSNSHKGTARCEKYGKKGITGYGRKMVKSAATLIQKMPGKRTTFATVTMPTLPTQLRRELALAWPELLRQLLQWLSRELRRVGLPALVCSVSEVQPGRLAEHSEAYLHLHLVWPNHWAKAGNWAVDVDRLRTWVAEFLQRRGLWCTEAWVNVDTQQVKKTAAGYLSKYMSKGSDVLEAFAEDCGWDAVPGQWWNLTKPARDLVVKFSCQGVDTGRLLLSVIDHAMELCELDSFWGLNQAMMTIGKKEVHVGWYGGLKEAVRLDLVKMLRSAERCASA